MLNFNIHEAKTNLSSIIAQVEAGEDVVIMRAGKPVARLMRYEKPAPRKFDYFKGQVEILDGFYEPITEKEWLDFDDPEDPLNWK